LVNLPNVWLNPARKSAIGESEKFARNTEKILLNLAANQLKWQLADHNLTPFVT